MCSVELKNIVNNKNDIVFLHVKSSKLTISTYSIES